MGTGEFCGNRKKAGEAMGGTAPQAAGQLLLSAREAARALGIGERTLWTQTRAGGLPCIRIGRRVLYAPRDLEVWIDGRRRGGAPDADAGGRKDAEGT